MPIDLEPAVAEDVPALVELRAAVNRRLEQQHGRGYWSVPLTEAGARLAMRRAKVYVLRGKSGLMATLALSTRKPWAIDKICFPPVKSALYLTAMAVDPDCQGQGIGRACIAACLRVAAAWPAQAVRLDAYDHAAGAGPFYAKCGFGQVGRAVYRNVPLLYFNRPL
jgi:GNAT superfamily N-acetyltransferase